MKFFSTFSGIGGFEIGIQNAYRSKVRGEQANPSGDEGQGFFTEEGENTSSEDGRIGKRPTDFINERPLCVGYSEIDKYAIKVYERHFNHENYGDITKINADELPDFDCLVGGFPCQAFSIAGKRGGFDDTRGTLFFDLARILRAKQPRLFVFENVKGLLSHDGGKSFKTIVQTIDELGYDCQWQVLNSKNHGVPQNRERIIIVGHLRGTSRPEVFPITGSGEQTVNEVEVAGTLETDGWEKRFEQIRRVHSTGGISPTIPTGTGGGVMTKVLENTRIRRLTPLECERLQGFPDNWTKLGVGDWAEDRSGRLFVEMSDSQRYKMCGNAVTTNVIQAVFEMIFASV